VNLAMAWAQVALGIIGAWSLMLDVFTTEQLMQIEMWLLERAV
jgi:hypothetical protein